MLKPSRLLVARIERSRSKWQAISFSILAFVLIVAGFVIILPYRQTVLASSGSGVWPTYLEGNTRSGFNQSETTITPSSAPNLKLRWSYSVGGNFYVKSITTQPVEANGLIYWGSWDGNEHATNLNGTQVWQKGIGYTFDAQCNNLVGVASTATVNTLSIGGTSTPVLFVGGGNATFYALNANTGATIWSTPLGSSPDHFIYSSPAFYRGSIYIGLSSFGDCPLVQGQLIKLNATTGTIQHIFNVVPAGCLGGGVWGSPTIDPTDNSVYFATGNAGSCSSGEPYTAALVKVKASDLSSISSWQVPVSEQINDSDFGSTPTLFKATIGGVQHLLVGIANKNGTYYAFDRSFISTGPLWQANIATIGGGCGPDCGDGSISPSAWGGSVLYVAGGQTTIAGVSCKGSLRALSPATGNFLWEHCLNDGPVLGAVSLVRGVAIVGEGTTLAVIAAPNGHTLYTYTDTNNNSYFYGPASVSNGVLYIGNFDGYLYAFGN
jgi:outer membrane protein assembly factor BamB